MGACRDHPWLTGLAAIVVVVALVFSQLVGLLIPITVVLLVLVGGLAVVIHRWLRRRRGAGSSGLIIASAVLATAVVAVGIQAIPYGRAQTNDAVTGEPQWADQTTRDLMVRACYDCHSNEVEYPAYASVAPISWAVEFHVSEGREAVNYSTFTTDRGQADDSIEVILDGSMPPAYFTRFGLHPEAVLTDAERDVLVAGLRNTPGLSEDGGRGRGGDGPR